MHGHVYILTNRTMPGLVKIGRTCRSVDLRASELWQTGVPERFDVFWHWKTPDCVQLEAYAHAALSSYRISKSREFFRVDPEFAYQTVCLWAKFQADDWVSEQFTSVCAATRLQMIAASALEVICEESGLSEKVIARALSVVSADELKPAIDRAIEELKAERAESLERIGVPESEWPEDICNDIEGAL